MTDPANLNLSAPSGSDMGEGVVERLARDFIDGHGWSPSVLPELLAFARTVRALSTSSSTLTPDADPAGDGKLPFQDEVEKVLIRRLYANQLEGHTLATAHEIATLFATPAIRNRAFEEAAMVCDGIVDASPYWSDDEVQRFVDCAARIRALKGTPPIEDERERDGHTLPATDPPDFEYPGPHDDLGPVIGGSDQ